MADDAMKAIREKALAVGNFLSADILVYGGGLYPPYDASLVELVKSRRRRKNLLLILTTLGGIADVAYRIGRCLQKAYCNGGKISVLIPYECKSAGTLLACCGDELIMCDLAELGPLDVQITKADELFERSSGLTPIQALKTLRQQAFIDFQSYLVNLRRSTQNQLSTRFSADMAVKMVGDLLSPIYAQIDPIRLGETHRAMEIAKQYAFRLAGRNIKGPEALEELVSGYPSHGFIIDREEAQTLFHRVREPEPIEAELISLLAPVLHDLTYDEEAEVEFIIDEPAAPKADSTKEKGATDDKDTSSENPAVAGAPSTEDRPVNGDSQPGGATPNGNPAPQADTALKGHAKKSGLMSRLR